MCCVLRPDDFEMAGSDYHQTYFLTIPIKSSNEQKKKHIKSELQYTWTGRCFKFTGVNKTFIREKRDLVNDFWYYDSFCKTWYVFKGFPPVLVPINPKTNGFMRRI